MPRRVGKLESREEQAKQIFFRFLTEFRSWLDINKDKDILDIRATGAWDEMKIIVTYQEK